MPFLLLSLIFSASALAEAARLTVLEGEFSVQKATITAQLKDGTTYSEITQKDRRDVLAALDRIEHALDGVNSVDDLDPDQRVDLFNNQEMVNVLLTNAARDSQLLCTRQETVGTRFKKIQCETRAERRERHEAARKVLEKIAPRYRESDF